MPLRFDPSALMAQGGIMHGFDDLGAAVMNAMNSRAARKYQAEHEARQAARQDTTAATGRDTKTQEEANAEERALEAHVLQDPRQQLRKTGRKIESFDALGNKTMTDEQVPYTSAEIPAVIAERKNMVRGLSSRYGSRVTLPSRFAEASKAWMASNAPSVPDAAPAVAPGETHLTPTAPVIAALAARPVGEKLAANLAAPEPSAMSAWNVLNPAKMGWWGEDTTNYTQPPLMESVPSDVSRRVAAQLALTQPFDAKGAADHAAKSLQPDAGDDTEVPEGATTGATPRPAPKALAGKVLPRAQLKAKAAELRALGAAQHPAQAAAFAAARDEDVVASAGYTIQ